MSPCEMRTRRCVLLSLPASAARHRRASRPRAAARSSLRRRGGTSHSRAKPLGSLVGFSKRRRNSLTSEFWRLLTGRSRLLSSSLAGMNLMILVDGRTVGGWISSCDLYNGVLVSARFSDEEDLSAEIVRINCEKPESSLVTYVA